MLKIVYVYPTCVASSELSATHLVFYELVKKEGHSQPYRAFAFTTKSWANRRRGSILACTDIRGHKIVNIQKKSKDKCALLN